MDSSTPPKTNDDGPGALPGAAWKMGPFLFIIVLPTILMLVAPSDSAEQMENRRLTAFPEIPSDRDAFLAWPGAFSAYAGDHFGLRADMIRSAAWIRRKVNRNFGMMDMILRGEDDLLFFASNKRTDTVQQYRGVYRFSGAQLAEAARRLDAWRAYAESRGSRFYFVVAPNKVSLYPESLPDHLRTPVGPGMKDVLVEHLRTHTGIEVVTLIDGMRSLKETSERPLYFRTDTHWNKLGAFAAYRHLASALGNDFPGIAPRAIDGFVLETIEAPGGDLAKFLATADVEKDIDFAFTPRFALEIECSGEEPRKWGGLHRIVNKSRSEGPKAVVFHDSFFFAMESFLADHLSELVLLWSFDPTRDAYFLDADLIDAERPDFVIFEMLERYLYSLPDLPLPPSAE